MENKIIFGLAAMVLLCAFAATANAFESDENARISFDVGNVTIEQGQTIGVVVTLENNFEDKKCFTLKTSTTSYFDVEANLPQGMKSACLNAGESTKFNLAIHAFDDADNDNYTVVLRAIDGNSGAIASIDVEISEDAKSIDLIASSNNICRNKYGQAISVLVKNDYGYEQEIKLAAESELFLPSFEPEEIILDDGEQRFVELKINVNETTALGKYEIPIFARTENEYVQSTASFNVIECEAPKKRILELSLQKNCVQIEKGKSKLVSFRVKNISEDYQAVSLASTGDLVSDLSKKTAIIEPESSISVDLNIHAEDAASGKHTVSVWAWNDLDRIGGDFCVEVGKSRAIEVTQLNDNVSVPRDEAEIVSFEIKNTGDYTETVTITITNNNANVTISTQSSTITLTTGQTKNAFVVISPNLNAALGQKSATVKFAGAGATITKTINFYVEKETTRQKINVIKAIQYPEKIVVTEGGKTTYYLTIENPTTERVTGLGVIVTGLPDGITASAITGISLNPKERKTVFGTMEFAKGTAGTYKANFEIKNDAYKTTVPFAITVNEAKGDNGFLSGLLGLGSEIAFGLVTLVIIVFLALLLSGNKAAKNREQPWVMQEREPKELWQNPIAKP